MEFVKYVCFYWSSLSSNMQYTNNYEIDLSIDNIEGKNLRLVFMRPVKRYKPNNYFPKLWTFSPRNCFVFLFEEKGAFRNIYQEDFFLINEAFPFLGGDSSSSGDFCWTSLKPCSHQQNRLKMPKPTKDFLVKCTQREE